jgi:hypothetical protein
MTTLKELLNSDNNYCLPEANKGFEAYLPYNEIPILYTVISYL